MFVVARVPAEDVHPVPFHTRFELVNAVVAVGSRQEPPGDPLSLGVRR